MTDPGIVDTTGWTVRARKVGEDHAVRLTTAADGRQFVEVWARRPAPDCDPFGADQWDYHPSGWIPPATDEGAR